jgi:hypothetical protein
MRSLQQRSVSRKRVRLSLVSFASKREIHFCSLFFLSLLERNLVLLMTKHGMEDDAEKLMQGELTMLDLSCCEIGDDEAVIVAVFIKDDDSVEEVYLYRNNIGPRGAKAIADTLKHNKKLRSLSLVNNQVGNQGAELRDARNHFRLPCGDTEGIPFTRGVRQGDPLSSLLFCIAINPLLCRFEQIIESHKQINHTYVGQQAYADDVDLIANSRVTIRELWDGLLKYCEITNLEINSKKTFYAASELAEPL